MVQYGFALSTEEHPPSALVHHAQLAEDAGFDFVSVTDHYHPWLGAQGHSSFVWSILAAAGSRTSRLRFGTGVTCPIMRIHPAVLAQASATTACLLPGRFFFGVGSGEALNEHVVGRHWPRPAVRLEMMEEAVGIIRDLWSGRVVNHEGRHFKVEHARLYDPPPEPPPVVVSALGPRAAEVAGRIGDGYWGTSADASLIDRWRSAGGSGPCYGQINVCWDDDEGTARETARRQWANAALVGQVPRELKTPRHVEEATAAAGEDSVAQSVVCGPDAGPIIEKVRTYVEAGYDHLYFHQIGPRQDDFFRFYAQDLRHQLP